MFELNIIREESWWCNLDVFTTKILSHGIRYIFQVKLERKKKWKIFVFLLVENDFCPLLLRRKKKKNQAEVALFGVLQPEENNLGIDHNKKQNKIILHLSIVHI